MPSFIMVCEGRSERTYLQRLQSFLDDQTVDWNVPLRFITRESLSRLKANLARPPVPVPDDLSFRSFVHFLIDQINAAFPDLLV